MNYFKIQEFVSKKTYNKYGDKCVQFIDQRILDFINKLREDLKKPITINNWLWNGSFEQRGLRTNLDEIVKNKTNKDILYVSQHTLGKAIDFNVKGMSNKETYEYIIKNYHTNGYDKYITRIEHIDSAPNWIHVDCANTGKKELYIFK